LQNFAICGNWEFLGLVEICSNCRILEFAEIGEIVGICGIGEL
jgi:hypothetical protein